MTKRFLRRICASLLAAALLTGTPASRPRADEVSGEEASSEAGWWDEEAGDEEDTDVQESTEKEPQKQLTEADFQEELNDLSDQLLDLKKQQDEVAAQIAGAQSEKEKKLVEKTHWETQIQLTQDEITLLEERIALLDEQIEQKMEEIQQKEEDIAYNYDQYKQRMRASYMAGEASTLSMVLGASDFTDFLMRTEIVRATAQRDQELLETLRSEREELEQAKAELEESQRAVEESEAQMQEKQKELESELENTQSQIEDISLLEQAYLERKAELDEMDKQVQAEIDAIYEKIDNSMAFVGGIFGWPLPGFSTITSYYGWRFNNTNFHTGIDISGSGVYGHSIVASNSGTVAYVQNAYTDGVGYGKHVIVNHGGGYTTLYAHMSSISVQEGDHVTRGVTEIGKVGSTGWSTGPHLHFEVRIDGQTQNPLEFLQ